MNYLHIILLFISILLILSCESSIQPVSNTGKEYSVYGALDIQKPPNHIRVYNTKKLLTPESTEKLDVQVHFTDLGTMQSEILEDQIIKFDNIYTHNYKIDSTLKFDNRYKVEWEDGDGFFDHLITITPNQAKLTIVEDSVRCGEEFLIHLSNINLNAGEQLLSEVAVQVNNTWFGLPISRSSIYEYSQTEMVLLLGWTPGDLISFIFGQNSGVSCTDLTSNKLRYRFTHVGYMEGDYTPSENFPDSTGLFMNKQIVLAKYSDETEITVIFEDVSEN